MKIIIRNKKDFRQACQSIYRYFKKYVEIGKPVKVEVKRALSQRSTSQNRYYWGVIVKMIAEYTGHEPDEVHSFLKLKHLRRGDGVIEWTRSTTELDTAEFEAYCEKCRLWALNELNINIPLPNEYEDFGEDIKPLPF